MKPENVFIICGLLFFVGYFAFIAFAGLAENELKKTLATLCINKQMQWIDNNCVVKP